MSTNIILARGGDEKRPKEPEFYGNDAKIVVWCDKTRREREVWVDC